MAYGLSNGHVTDDGTWSPKVQLLWSSTVGYPSDSLASCFIIHAGPLLYEVKDHRIDFCGSRALQVSWHGYSLGQHQCTHARTHSWYMCVVLCADGPGVAKHANRAIDYRSATINARQPRSTLSQCRAETRRYLPSIIHYIFSLDPH